MHVLKKKTTTTTSKALVWQTNLSSMSVTGIFSLKTVNDLTESITDFLRLLMNEVKLCSVSKWKVIVSKFKSVSRLWEFARLFGAIACVNLVFCQKWNFYAAFSR